MTQSPMNPNALHFHQTHKSGSAILAALGLLAVTAVVVAVTLSQARNRFRTSHHSARWTQAANAAEAGVELTLMSAQDGLWTPNGWTTAPGAPGTAAVTKTFPLSAGVPATGPISATVSVDKVALANLKWLRIRSTGSADVSGGALAGVDARDVLLRKLSLRRDRATGASVATPRATRTLEILAKPLSPFRRGILMDTQFNMSGGVIDSFDSSDPTKSTSTLYDAAKRQSNGDVGVNDTGGASNLGDSFVYGDVSYSGPAITNTSNVQGTVSTPFSDPIDPVAVPTWTSFSATPNKITTTMSLTGGTQSSPTRFKVSTLTYSGGETLTLAPHAVGAESYVEIWVTGDFKSSGTSQIILKPGVHVTYYIEGDITATGTTFVNESNVAANNTLNVVTQPPGIKRSVTFTGGGDFIGAINAPGSDFTLSGNASFSGAMIGKTMSVKGGASIHYDEALARADGEGGGYQVMSWVEAVR